MVGLVGVHEVAAKRFMMLKGDMGCKMTEEKSLKIDKQ